MNTLILLIASAIVAWVIFTFLLKVIKASLQTAITVALVVLILQIFFGIGPQQFWDYLTDLPQLILQD
ncbi:hypothetical protein PN462_04420 [Spirulina sp. CS-785/01]|uniref:hypothetical protein n=1 Tax=Spirulina sp. CS-785/01 TaxID=3021716 RepID=UPI00232CB8D3|nr:hypothetical protein [Spirulina sp. CS-785/01]MDB9312339.1 hypothetical protein [Spirulina sp. CS-785/01]